MKKLLISTSLATLFAANVLADGPVRGVVHDKGTLDIKLRGEIDGQMGTRFQSSANRTRFFPGGVAPESQAITGLNKNVALDSEVNLSLRVTARTSRGLLYGAHLGITPNTKGSTNPSKPIRNKTFIFAESSDMGRVEIGSNAGAADQMSLGAGSIAAATGGVNGDWFKYVAAPKVAKEDFIVNPALPLDNDIYSGAGVSTTVGNRAAEKTRKLTYLTPKFEGLQFGISYIPDTLNVGDKAVLPNNAPLGNGIGNAITAGITWNGSVARDHHLKVSLTGNYGQYKYATPAAGAAARTTSIKSTQAVQLGAVWTYREFSAAGSFGWLGKSNATTRDSGPALANEIAPKAAWFATAGLGMKVDKLYSSITAAYTKNYNTNKFWNVAAGLNYELAPGFLPYAELAYVNFNHKATNQANGLAITLPATADAATGRVVNKNTAVVLILGTKVKF